MTPKIYIIDDDVQMSEMLSAAVEEVGYTSIVFNDAARFLSEPATDNDIILLDLNMPEMDGIEVIRALASKQCKSSLILISGNDTSVLHSAEELARAHSLNIIVSLCKPIKVGRLQDLLKINVKGESTEKKFVAARSSAITAEELNNALKDELFILYFQPQIDLSSGEMVGAEALVRWKQADGSLIYPDEFI
ncbi:MAG: response regulator, partial [Gammaproteobacteria bacterium]|nr:response regulator [Gammaproteobacteria bacterium]